MKKEVHEKKQQKSKSKSKKIIALKGCPIEKKMGHSTRRKLKKKREMIFLSLSLLSLELKTCSNIPGDLPGREQPLLLAKHVYRGGFEYSGSSVVGRKEG